jgi:hypothetical protein
LVLPGTARRSIVTAALPTAAPPGAQPAAAALAARLVIVPALRAGRPVLVLPRAVAIFSSRAVIAGTIRDTHL